MTIIAATDFSPVANNAVRSALHLARALGDSLLLVRVLQPMVEAYPELRVPESAVFDAALRQANEAEMEKALTALRSEGVTVEGLTLVGAPASALGAQATATKARLIVMGLRGHGAAWRLVMGSVVERTILEAPCPVLVVPESAAPFEAWSSGSRPLRALVGLDLDAASTAVLEQVKQLRQGGPCDAIFVHTYWPPEEYSRLGYENVPRDLLQSDPQIVAVLEREVRARVELPGGPGSNALRIESAWGRRADTLALDAGAERADLVVVGTRQPHGWDRLKGGSSALGALRAARTAVLCVPARLAPVPLAKAPSIPRLRRILAATDFSELGNAAVPHAYALLRGSGGVVELCHVHRHEPPIPALPVYDLRQEALPAAERRQLEERLTALIPPEADALGIATHVTVIDGGSPAEAIVQAARRLGVDAIAIGSHGRTGISRAVLGSVSEAVVRSFERPVYVVRAPAN
jgi:nucleotide-binding universal stress UspA family protein